MNDKIWLSSPHMGDQELSYVMEAFDTNWIAPLGPHVDGFETDLANYLGEETGVAALSAGTAAIHLALIILGIKAGDEVICQSITFSASANPIAYQGATPVFVGSEAETWNMCPEHLERAIQDRMKKGNKPKAIILVHLYGMPAQMDRIMAIADHYEIPVIEDAAEALGSTYKGRALGTFGAIGVLSFNGNKIITTSGGGAIISKNKEWVDEARFLATQARDKAPYYLHSHIGYNYRMSNVCAAIGRGQMLVLPQRVEKRRANYAFYQERLKDIPGIRFIEEPDSDYFSNRWLSTFLIESTVRKKVMEQLGAHNIECRPFWKPMHTQPIFKDAPYYGDSYTDYLFEHGLCLPSGSNLLDEELEKVAEIIKNTVIEKDAAVNSGIGFNK